MQPIVKTVPNKNMYVNEAFQAQIDELRDCLVANGVKLTDHTGVVRDVVLFRWLVEQERIRQGLDAPQPAPARGSEQETTP